LRAYAWFWAAVVLSLCFVFVVTPNATDLGPKSANYLLTLAPAAGVGTYTLATGLADTEHLIELYRRTEGKVGVTQFLGYEFPNGGQLLSPPLAPPRRIEFVGDSTTNGYGNECTAPTQSFSGATQNERLAFSGIAAHDLDADHHDISFSGKGVLLNYTRSDAVVFDELYPRAMPGAAAPAWAFAEPAPHVVWITLGGNDWDQDRSTIPWASAPDVAQFTSKYVALAALVRSKYPDAHVFVAIAPSLNDDYPYDVVNAANVSWKALTNMRSAVASVVATRAAAGDTKIYAYEFTRADHDADLTGCSYHANLALHRRMADEVLVQVRAKTGWP
jgi:lysophospholipase L1-like esterase